MNQFVSARPSVWHSVITSYVSVALTCDRALVLSEAGSIFLSGLLCDGLCLAYNIIQYFID